MTALVEEVPEHRPVLGKVPRADYQRLECACGWLWDDSDPLDDPEGVDFIRHLDVVRGMELRELREAARAVVDAWDNGRSYGNGRLKLPTDAEENALRSAVRAADLMAMSDAEFEQRQRDTGMELQVRAALRSQP